MNTITVPQITVIALPIGLVKGFAARGVNYQLFDAERLLNSISSVDRPAVVDLTNLAVQDFNSKVNGVVEFSSFAGDLSGGSLSHDVGQQSPSTFTSVWISPNEVVLLESDVQTNPMDELISSLALITSECELMSHPLINV